VFLVHGVDDCEKAILHRELRRQQLLPSMSQPCLVGMEACGGAQYWAREMAKLGHEVRLMRPQFVRAYVTRRIRAMRIRDHPTASHSPWQNGHVERLIGSIRRECLDHLIVFDEAQRRRVLKNYAAYYNQLRTHLSLDRNAPDFRCPQKLCPIASISILGELHHQYVRLLDLD
jgi:transposase